MDHGTRRNTFTLLELLIVVGIIGILISMLLPSLNAAREKARLAVCSSNLSQHGQALAAFGSDNNGRFPTVPGNGDLRAGWSGITPLTDVFPRYKSLSFEKRVLNRYMSVTDSVNAFVFQCPSALDKGRVFDTGSFYASATKYLKNVRTVDHKSVDLYRAKVNNPSELVVMTSNKTYKVLMARPYDKKFLSHNTYFKSPFLFVDGHVTPWNKYSPLLFDYDGYTFNNRQ